MKRSRQRLQKAIEDGLLSTERRVYLNDLLDLPQSTELRTLYDAMDNAARNAGKRATVAELVTRASGRRPRLLAIEDLHWADGSRSIIWRTSPRPSLGVRPFWS